METTATSSSVTLDASSGHMPLIKVVADSTSYQSGPPSTPDLVLDSSSSDSERIDSGIESEDGDWVKRNWPGWAEPNVPFDFEERIMTHLNGFLDLLSKAEDDETTKPFQLPLDIRDFYFNIATGCEGEYVEIKATSSRGTRRRVPRRPAPIAASKPQPKPSVQRSQPALNDKWGDCSDVTDLEEEVNGDDATDFPDDVSVLTSISEIDAQLEAGNLGRPILIDYLPRAEESAFKTFDVIDENIRRFKDAGLIAEPELSRHCRCGSKIANPDLTNVCGEDSPVLCINRSCKFECKPEECFAPHLCQNQRIRKKQFADLEVVHTKRKGYGLRAGTDVPEGAFVCEYTGEVISSVQFENRFKKYSSPKYNGHIYMMQLKLGEYIDATQKGGIARFANHSCQPNCQIEQWIVGSYLRMILVANRKIWKGEEITFNYNMNFLGDSTVQKCFCKAKRCTGFIGAAAKPKVHALSRSSSPGPPTKRQKTTPEDKQELFSSLTPENNKEAANERPNSGKESILLRRSRRSRGC